MIVKNTSEVTEFTIKRSEWIHGFDKDNSCLYRPSDGKKCCMGFYSLALGYIPSQIELVGYPSEIDSDLKYPKWLMNFEIQDRLAVINDMTTLSESEREEQISAIFASNGVKVIFED